MNKQFHLFVEGDADQKFFEDFLSHHCEIQLLSNQISQLGGWQGLEKKQAKLKENEDDSILNIVIINADTTGNGGGFAKRKQVIEQIRTKLQTRFDFFLLPNNQDDGELETLLEKIINPKHQTILDCFNSYESCLQQKSTNYVLPNNKAKIFAYLEALKAPTSYSKRNHHNKEHFNLDNTYLKPLIKFFKDSFYCLP